MSAQVWNQVRDQVWHQAGNQVWGQIWDQVRNRSEEHTSELQSH